MSRLLPLAGLVLLSSCLNESTGPQVANEAPLLRRGGMACTLSGGPGGTGMLEPGSSGFFDINTDISVVVECAGSPLDGQTLPARLMAHLRLMGHGRVKGNAVLVVMTPGGDRVFRGQIDGTGERSGGNTTLDFFDLGLRNPGGHTISGEVHLIFGPNNQLTFDTEMMSLN